MKVFKCKFVDIVQEDDGFRLRVEMLEPHSKALADSGDMVTTSACKLINFEGGYAFTRNNVYKWKE